MCTFLITTLYAIIIRTHAPIIWHWPNMHRLESDEIIPASYTIYGVADIIDIQRHWFVISGEIQEEHVAIEYEGLLEIQDGVDGASFAFWLEVVLHEIA